MGEIVFVVSMVFAVFGPTIFAVIAGRFCAGRMEHISKRLATGVGVLVGIFAVAVTMVSPDVFIGIWTPSDYSDETPTRFHTVTGVLIALAVVVTAGVCFGINHWRATEKWNRG